MAKSWKARQANNTNRLQQLLDARDHAKGQRMANNDFTQLILRELMPWSSRTKGDTFGDSFWVGLNREQYVKRANEISDEILDAYRGNKRAKNAVRTKMVDEYGFTEGETDLQISRLQNPKASNKLSTLVMGVPNVSADEGIGVALMKGSGITGTRLNNKLDPVTSTDILAEIGSSTKGVDAQRRFGPVLNLGVFNHMKGGKAGDAERLLNRANVVEPNRKFGSILDEINTIDTGEDKFMQTDNRKYNRQLSPSMAAKIDNFRKDFLISADMSDFHQDEVEKRLGFRRNQGPYDPRPGQDYQMIDLDMMRDMTRDMNMQEMYDRGYTFNSSEDQRGKGGLKMIVPRKELMLFSDNDLLDREIINEVTKRKNHNR